MFCLLPAMCLVRRAPALHCDLCLVRLALGFVFGVPASCRHCDLRFVLGTPGSRLALHDIAFAPHDRRVQKPTHKSGRTFAASRIQLLTMVMVIVILKDNCI